MLSQRVQLRYEGETMSEEEIIHKVRISLNIRKGELESLKRIAEKYRLKYNTKLTVQSVIQLAISKFLVNEQR